MLTTDSGTLHKDDSTQSDCNKQEQKQSLYDQIQQEWRQEEFLHNQIQQLKKSICDRIQQRKESVCEQEQNESVYEEKQEQSVYELKQKQKQSVCGQVQQEGSVYDQLQSMIENPSPGVRFAHSVDTPDEALNLA